MKYLSDDRGNVAILLAVCILPLLFLAGLMVDFSRQQNVSREAQSALDHAAISVALLLQENENAAQVELNLIAQTVFDGNLTASSNLTGTPLTVTHRDGVAAVSFSGSVETGLSGLLGVEKLSFSLDSAAQFGGPKSLIPLDIALVLDVSESMKGERIDELRQSANELIDLAIPDDSSPVRMGIVPFNNYINVGLQNRNQSWLVGTESETNAFENCSFDDAKLTAASCSVRRVCTENLATESSSCRDVLDCPSGVSVPRDVCETVNRVDSWFGCVQVRDTPNDILDDFFGGDPIVAELDPPNSPCRSGNAILPLTGDAVELRRALDNLAPNRATYIPSGLSWGQRILSPGEPFDVDDNGTLPTKAIILMSDGANTRSVNQYNQPEGRDVGEANMRMVAACDEAKANGIQIFTIAFLVNDIATEKLLRDCATTSEGSFDVDGERELTSAFLDIASSFNQIALVE